MYDLDDDEQSEKAVFAQKFTQLLMAISMNYEILFITPNNAQWGKKLFELIMVGSRAKNLNIVVQTTEFWPEFKQSLQDCIPTNRASILSEID